MVLHADTDLMRSLEVFFDEPTQNSFKQVVEKLKMISLFSRHCSRRKLTKLNINRQAMVVIATEPLLPSGYVTTLMARR